MASTWGDAWLDAWGDSWGVRVPGPEPEPEPEPEEAPALFGGGWKPYPMMRSRQLAEDEEVLVLIMGFVEMAGNN